ALYMIGIGLNDEKDITVKGLDIVKKCSKVYLESYTSKLNCSIEDLEKFYEKKVIPVDREFVENHTDELLTNEEDIALLIIGDVFSATTHYAVFMRAKELGIKVHIIHNASVLTAVGITGLSLYKFGKTASIPFENENIESPYDVLKENKNLHTLFLLDLNPKQNKFMPASEAIDYLMRIEEKRKENVFTKEKLCIVCAQLGSDSPVIRAGSAEELLNLKIDKFPQCLIVPGDLNFIEEEFIQQWKK
ncbi:MAG: diphthine synthase, partial [Candidatus Aenigmatarchaeota archaeon]